MMHASSELAFVSALGANSLLRIMLALIFCCLILRALLLARLRTKHRDVWVALGMPTIFGTESASNGLLRFTGVRGPFRQLHDRVLNALVLLQRVAIIATILSFVGALVLGFLGRK